jgi:UDP-3-O-[3-hydroxymyristoyl] glucosamine N-acyltransferase
MQNTIFYTRPKGRVHKLAELAELFQAKIIGDSSINIDSVADITQAKSGELSFIDNIRYQDWLSKTQASVVCVSLELENEVTRLYSQNKAKTFLLHSNPRYVFAKICQVLYPNADSCSGSGIHASAIIDASAKIDKNVVISANCVIGKNTTIASGTIIKANTVIGANVQLGQNCLIHPNVTIYHECQLGNQVIIHSGAVIGSDGFGFENEKGKWEKVPQLGRVIIGDHVEIGANTCIDRGALKDTIINRNIILDNLIQIAHNVEIGEGTAIAGCTAIAGSTKIGKYCLIGGSSRINGHIEITDKVTLLGGTNVVQSISQPGAYSSAINEQPAQSWKRTLFRLHRLDELNKRVKALENINKQQYLTKQEES